MSHVVALRLIDHLNEFIELAARERLNGTSILVALSHLTASYQHKSRDTRISIARLSLQLGIDPSSVTRAYQQLARAGVLQRQQPKLIPGASPEVATTTWCIGRVTPASLTASAPTPTPRCETSDTPAIRLNPSENTAPVVAPAPATSGAAMEPEPGVKVNFLALSRRLSPTESQSLLAYIDGRSPAMHFDTDSALSPDEQTELARVLARKREERLVPAVETKTRAPSTPLSPVPAPAFHKNVEDAGAFARRVLQREFPQDADRLCNEITWSITQGALARITKPVAELWGIAVRKVRQGQWTTPHDYAASPYPSCKVA